MDQYDDIRKMYQVEGISQRKISKMLGISRNTVKKYIEGQNIPGPRPFQEKAKPVTGPVRDIIISFLEEDQSAPRKQRHTAKRIYDRLRTEHGYQGAYSTLRPFVRELKEKYKAFIPLEFDPGEAAQVDWGTAFVYLNDKKTEVQYFCMRLCYSGAIFVMVFPNQKYESLLWGHRMAFEYFGGVPRKLIYDNMRTVVKEGWGRSVRDVQAPFKLLRAHYAFESAFCNPREGHEKGLVENLVGFARKNVMVPVPRIANFTELNDRCVTYCDDYHQHKIASKPLTVGEMLKTEQTQLMPLPIIPHDCLLTKTADINPFCLARIDNNQYSVPAHLCGKSITVKTGAFDIELWYHGKQVAAYERVYASGQVRYRIEHYIPLLERSPRSVWNAAPVRHSGIAPLIADYGSRINDTDRDMQFVKILKLVLDHGQSVVLVAVRKAMAAKRYSFEMVKFYLNQVSSPEMPSAVNLDKIAYLPGVQPVDLGQYDTLVEGGAAR